MLPRIDRRVHSTRRGRGMDLPEKRGSTKKAGVLTVEEYVHSEASMKYAQMMNIDGRSAKAPERIASNLLWWEVNYYT
jgi:hypothetical protein